MGVKHPLFKCKLCERLVEERDQLGHLDEAHGITTAYKDLMVPTHPPRVYVRMQDRRAGAWPSISLHPEQVPDRLTRYGHNKVQRQYLSVQEHEEIVAEAVMRARKELSVKVSGIDQGGPDGDYTVEQQWEIRNGVGKLLSEVVRPK